MKIYGGHEGKRVSKEKRSFKLFKQKGGKRLSQKPVENNYIQQTIQFFSGKIKYLSSRFQEFCGQVSYDELDQEFLKLPKQEETENIEENFIEPYFPMEQGSAKVVSIQVSSLTDIDDVVYYVEEGYIVIANYKLLNMEARKEFDKRLSTELMLLGTHLTHITQADIICASRQVSVIDTISEKKEGKIYELNAVMKR